MKKLVFLPILAVMLLSALAGCGGGQVTDDVAVSGIAARVDDVVGAGGSLTAMDENYIESYMGFDVSEYADYVVKLNTQGANVDEYGVFHGKDEAQTKEIEQAVKDYFAFRLETWMPEYMPEELPKLEAQRYEVRGNYVIYTILSDEAADAAFKAFSECLTEG